MLRFGNNCSKLRFCPIVNCCVTGVMSHDTSEPCPEMVGTDHHPRQEIRVLRCSVKQLAYSSGTGALEEPTGIEMNITSQTLPRGPREPHGVVPSASQKKYHCRGKVRLVHLEEAGGADGDRGVWSG